MWNLIWVLHNDFKVLPSFESWQWNPENYFNAVFLFRKNLDLKRLANHIKAQLPQWGGGSNCLAHQRKFRCALSPCLLGNCHSDPGFDSGCSHCWKYPWARYEPGQRPTMLTVKRSAMCITRVGSRGMYITFASAMRWIRQNPLWLWNPKDMSPEIQNRGTSGPKIGHMSDKKKKMNESSLKKKNKKKLFHESWSPRA